MDWILDNKVWIFSGIGVAIIGWIWNFFFNGKKNKDHPNNINQNSNVINLSINKSSIDEDKSISLKAKSDVKILFIDDEKFDIVSILKGAGWLNTKTIKDVMNLDSVDIKNANVIFVDINGVGCKLFPKDQGLGLADAIKTRYPEKYIVIYSAQEQRLHKAFSIVDVVLPKNAEPYEFTNILDSYLRNKI